MEIAKKICYQLLCSRGAQIYICMGKLNSTSTVLCTSRILIRIRTLRGIVESARP